MTIEATTFAIADGAEQWVFIIVVARAGRARTLVTLWLPSSARTASMTASRLTNPALLMGLPVMYKNRVAFR